MIQILVDILDRLCDVLLFFFVFVLLTNYLIDIPFYVSCKPSWQDHFPNLVEFLWQISAGLSTLAFGPLLFLSLVELGSI